MSEKNFCLCFSEAVRKHPLIVWMLTKTTLHEWRPNLPKRLQNSPL